MSQPKAYAIPGVRAQVYKPPGADASPVISPAKSKKSKKDTEFKMEDPAERLSILLDLTGLTPEEKAMRITIWNRVEQRKIAGTAAPLRKNLATYLNKNNQCDVFVGQDKFNGQRQGEIDERTGSRVVGVTRVTMWNPVKRTKITGNAAPLPKNLKAYFERNPGMEIYNGQDLIGNPRARGGRSQSQNQNQNLTLNQDQKKDNPPGIHFPLIASTSRPTNLGLDTEANKRSVQVNHETHEVVSDSNLTENAVGNSHSKGNPGPSSNSCGSTERTEITMSPKSSCPIPFNGGNPQIGTDEHDFRNLGEMTYDDMASSWSNTPVWTDPNCTYKLEPKEPFVTALQAERSLVVEDRPMDLAVELQDCPPIGCEIKALMSESPPPSNVNQVESIEADDVNLSFDDYFIDDPAENMSTSMN